MTGTGVSPMNGGEVRLQQLAKAYETVPAVAGIDLDIPAGQFYSLLGASGCGKTTTLRMIAGFEKPDSGLITIDGRDITYDPPNARPVNTVFQNYALFPFMSVRDNIAFGLRYQRADKHEARRRVDEALELVQMGNYAARRPGQLSGGQQQRVALARALVLRPRVLLLDEPLGALDAKLRKRLQLELRAVQREVGITFIYVTHDQEEALTMSDQIAVIAHGQVEQVGSPADIYSAPATTYVAEFLGTANIFDATVISCSSGESVCQLVANDAQVIAHGANVPAQEAAAIVIRPERIHVLAGEFDDPPFGHNVVAGTVAEIVYLGASTHIHVALERSPDARLLVEVPNHAGPSTVHLQPGASVRCAFPAEAVQILTRSPRHHHAVQTDGAPHPS